jgi:hypothetical protein
MLAVAAPTDDRQTHFQFNDDVKAFEECAAVYVGRVEGGDGHTVGRIGRFLVKGREERGEAHDKTLLRLIGWEKWLSPGCH